MSNRINCFVENAYQIIWHLTYCYQLSEGCKSGSRWSDYSVHLTDLLTVVYVCKIHFLVLYSVLAGHPLRGWPARLRGHKGSGLWKVWTVPSPPLPSSPLTPLPSPALSSPALSSPPSLPRAKFDQAGSSRLTEARECGAALAISEWTL